MAKQVEAEAPKLEAKVNRTTTNSSRLLLLPIFVFTNGPTSFCAK